MHLPQLLKLFNIDIQQLRKILAKHIQVPDLRMVREVPAEWEAILAKETGRPSAARPMFATVREASAAADASLLAGRSGTPDNATDVSASKPRFLPPADQPTKAQTVPVSLPTSQREDRIFSASSPKATVANRRPPQSAPPVRRPLPNLPLEADMSIAQVTSVVAEKGFGFVKRLGSGEEIFWHIRNLTGGTPAENDWLIVANQASARHSGKQEVKWAQPLQADLPLLSRVLQAATPDLLLAVIKSLLPEGVQAMAVTELMTRLQPITDEAGLAAGTKLLDAVGQQAPEHSSMAIAASLATAAPAYEWQLWVRYLSPLRDLPTEAQRVIELVRPLPAVVESWWPSVAETSIVGLYQALVHQLPADDKLLATWQQLKTALGNQQQLVFDSLVQQWVEQLARLDSLTSFQQYQQVIALTWGSQTPAQSLLLARLSEALQLEVWLLNERMLAFPLAIALTRFAELAPAKQMKVAAQLSDVDFLSVSAHLTAASPEPLRQRARQLLLLPLLADTLAAFALDLESDRETIQEVAWGRPDAWQIGQGNKGVQATLTALAAHTAGAGQLVVGHNVRDFDAPILAGHGVLLAADCLWDTLLVEMALSPDLQVFALQTSHSAAADAEITWHLFLNQVQRLLLVTPVEWNSLQPLFSPPVAATLAALRHQTSKELLPSVAELERERLTWFRPQPVSSALVHELQTALAAANLPPSRLVLAPLLVWAEASRLPDLRFWPDETTTLECRELDEAAVSRQLAGQPIEAVWVTRFFAWCQQQHIVPTATAMAPVMRVRLRQHVVMAECLVPAPPFDGNNPGTFCLTPDQLQTARVPQGGWPRAALLLVAPSLLSLTGKRLLRDKLGLQDLLATSPATRTEWLKFSGGQSFVGLTRAQALELRAEIPAGYEHFWLEKRRYGSFRVWGGFRWEALLARLRPLTTRTVGEQAQSFPQGQLRSIAMNVAQLQQRLGITPFYPESIYRARYWVLQAELVDDISCSRLAPLVLLVTRPEEVAGLVRYFEQRGYFVPAPSAALARQLELLHESLRPRRVLVASVAQGPALLRANYRGPVELLLDGFSLTENYFLAQGSRLFEQARLVSGGQAAPGISVPYPEEAADARPDDEQLPDDSEAPAADSNKEGHTEYLLRDTHFLLQLQLPLVQRWQALALGNHTDNRVWLLDPRLSQTPGLEGSWGLQPLLLDVPWPDEAAYQRAAAQAEELLGGGQPDTFFQPDVEHAKSLLQQVFLKFWDKQLKRDVVHSWKAEQLLYLDRILPAPANLSLLVSLPTGGGKSLLFQAPALYRSAYTNRLSIVVTPLKALMQDQVDALWQRGFYSSVEYLNQDRQDEVQQIYSRLAGGEIMLLFITPERFRSRRFERAFSQRLAADGGLEYAIFDEAHCISQWGHEFRPDYLHAARMVQGYRNTSRHKFPVLLFSATVTKKIYEGFTHLFG